MARKRRGLTRREVVAGAGALGALTVAAAGCGGAERGAAQKWDRETDVVVIGAGTGLVGALAALVQGAQVVVLEKRIAPGGTTALSGGVAWLPVNRVMQREGISDSRQAALEYLRHLREDQAADELLEAFVDAGPDLADFIEANTSIRWRVSRILGAVADYHPEWPGALARGRSIEPAIDEPRLYGGDLVQGLFDAVKSRGGEVLLETPARRLATRPSAGGAAEVLGVVAEREGRPFAVRARRGVILAAGGFEGDPELKRHFLRGPSPYAMGVATNTGDGIRMAMAAGADLRNMNECWGITVYTAEGEASLRGAGLPSLAAQIEKRSAGSIAVNRYGERFSNEAADYDSTWRSYLAWENWGELRYRNLPAFQIFDSTAREGGAIAGRKKGEALPDWVVQADTLRDLALRLGIDPDGLERTVASFNVYAREGRDPVFHRGESAYDRMSGAAPALVIGPVEVPPFFGAEVSPADLATCGGARVNRNAQVLSPFGEPIARLYASGNNAGVGSPGASYGGGGGTIGPALTFAYLAGRHAAGLSPWS